MAHTPNRSGYIIFLGITICLGLLSRSLLIPADSLVGKYAGDTLWAVAVYCSIALISTQWLPLKIALITAAISYGVELSQLYQAEWINTIRENSFVALILGNNFLWSDLLCYTAGACLAAVIDHNLIRKSFHTL